MVNLLNQREKTMQQLHASQEDIIGFWHSHWDVPYAHDRTLKTLMAAEKWTEAIEQVKADLQTFAGEYMPCKQRREQLIRRAVINLIDQLSGFVLLYLLLGDEGAAHKVGFGALDGALADTALDEGIGGVHLPAGLLGQHVRDMLGGAVALAPEDAHHL